MIKDIVAPRRAVARYHQLEARESHPSAGPMISENPNTAPFIPNTFVRSCGALISARIACATDIFPPVIPSNTLEKNMIRIGSETIQRISHWGSKLATAKTIQLRKVPACVIIKIGFLPYISESAQNIGAARNWNKLNVASNIPSTTSGWPYIFTRKGSTGNNMVIERPFTKVRRNTTKYFEEKIFLRNEII